MSNMQLGPLAVLCSLGVPCYPDGGADQEEEEEEQRQQKIEKGIKQEPRETLCKTRDL